MWVGQVEGEPKLERIVEDAELVSLREQELVKNQGNECPGSVTLRVSKREARITRAGLESGVIGIRLRDAS